MIPDGMLRLKLPKVFRTTAGSKQAAQKCRAPVERRGAPSDICCLLSFQAAVGSRKQHQLGEAEFAAGLRAMKPDALRKREASPQDPGKRRRPWCCSAAARLFLYPFPGQRACPRRSALPEAGCPAGMGSALPDRTYSIESLPGSGFEKYERHGLLVKMKKRTNNILFESILTEPEGYESLLQIYQKVLHDFLLCGPLLKGLAASGERCRVAEVRIAQ